ncbi:Crotonyl-CoA reductase [Baekduia alba]|uniref:zinc-dependent alcohol dehydrogenase family protein n=1 Tax=Baekduia alba TaxID=2997333 RepID=UPI00233FE4F2|nr:NAD(P)-dependent alcohol dehydrogenase [Baekduia alba]WCB95455.1 Crotonyl-CoA reductase [Baekduia alba]
MKAWTLTDFGIDNLTRSDVPTPEPGPRELLVEVGAVSLNFRDKAIAEGLYEPGRMPKGLIPVSDAAGRIVQIGTDVTRWAVGDRVVSHLYSGWRDGAAGRDEGARALGGPLDGGLAEYMVLEADSVVAAPAAMTDVQAATLPIAALTAWFALVEYGNLQAADTVLTQGTGGLSLFAIQLASALGARVIATSSSDDKLAHAVALGAAETINYRTTPAWDQEARALTDGRGVDHVLDVVGGDSLDRSIAASRVGGRVTVAGFIDGQRSSIDLMSVIFGRTRLQGIAVGHLRAFERLIAFLDRHAIEPVIDAVYGFEDAREAFAHLDRGPFGKVAIAVQG